MHTHFITQAIIMLPANLTITVTLNNFTPSVHIIQYDWLIKGHVLGTLANGVRAHLTNGQSQGSLHMGAEEAYSTAPNY